MRTAVLFLLWKEFSWDAGQGFRDEHLFSLVMLVVASHQHAAGRTFLETIKV